MASPEMQVYMKVINESPLTTLLQLPHKHTHIPPTGFVVRVRGKPLPFSFTLCPLFFCDADSIVLPGTNPHDVVVDWNLSSGSLERLLYVLYQRYKEQGIVETEESKKRYIFEKKLPPRKIVIPTLHRRENLEVVLQRFEQIDIPSEGYRPPILVIEHSPFPEFDRLCEEKNVEWMWFFLDPRIPHVPIGQFNKALCYDKAFLFGTPAEWYLFHDNDVLVPKDFWEKLDINLVRTNTKFIQPYTHRSLLNLYEEHADAIRKNLHKADEPILPTMYAPINPGAPGGSLYIHHDRYLEAGGHDPNFCWGYGPEDAFFFHKLSLLEPIAYADNPPIEMIHLWHPPAASQNPFYRAMDFLIKGYYMQQNRQELQSYLDEKKSLLNTFLPAHRRRA